MRRVFWGLVGIGLGAVVGAQVVRWANRTKAKYAPPNLARVQKGIDKLPHDWAAGKGDEAATLELFALLRDGKSEPACELALTQLTGGRVRAAEPERR